MHLGPAYAEIRHVRYWPKADLAYCAAHVRFRG